MDDTRSGDGPSVRRRPRTTPERTHAAIANATTTTPTTRATKEAALFCALAIGASWTWWGIVVLGVAAYAGGGAGSLERASVDGPLVAAGMAGPLVAALIMRLFVRREGLEGSIGAARRPALYAGAVGLPFALVCAALALAAAFGWASVTWDGSRATEFLALLVLMGWLAARTVRRSVAHGRTRRGRQR